MPMDNVELREKRGALIEEARKMLEHAESENRNLNAKEKEKYDKMWADAEDYLERAERIECQRKAEVEDAKPIEVKTEPDPTPEQRTKQEQIEEIRKKAFDKYLKYGETKLTEEEHRALSAGTDADGGYTIPPEDFRTDLIKNVDNLVHMRSLATVFRMTKAKKFTLPKLTADPSDPVWTSELQTGDEDSSMAFGQFEADPNPVAKRIKLSKTLIRQSLLPIEQLVRDRLAYKFGVVEENNFLNGDGSSKPLGVFVADANGIPTSQDLRFASATAIDADTFIKAKYQVPVQYWPNLNWLMNKAIMQDVALLKDTTNQYLLKPGLRDGQPETIEGFDVKLSEYAPSTKTANLYVGLLGDFTQYYIIDDLDFELQVVLELYAETNQIGYIGRRELDAKPAVAEAFCRLQMAAA